MKQTAKQTYKNKAANIQNMIDALQVALKEHAEEAHENGGHWGYTGDLGYVENQLTEMLQTFNAGGK